MGAFVISKKNCGQYKFVFTSRKGKTIFTSTGYDCKKECESAIEKVRNTVSQGVFVRFRASGGKYFFRLFLNETVVATSRKYTTELRLKKGIDEIVLYAIKSETLDFSELEEIEWE